MAISHSHLCLVLGLVLHFTPSTLSLRRDFFRNAPTIDGQKITTNISPSFDNIPILTPPPQAESPQEETSVVSPPPEETPGRPPPPEETPGSPPPPEETPESTTPEETPGSPPSSPPTPGHEYHHHHHHKHHHHSHHHGHAHQHHQHHQPAQAPSSEVSVQAPESMLLDYIN